MDNELHTYRKLLIRIQDNSNLILEYQGDTDHISFLSTIHFIKDHLNDFLKEQLLSCRMITSIKELSELNRYIGSLQRNWYIENYEYKNRPNWIEVDCTPVIYLTEIQYSFYPISSWLKDPNKNLKFYLEIFNEKKQRAHDRHAAWFKFNPNVYN